MATASDRNLATGDLPGLEVVALEVRRDAIEPGRIEPGRRRLQFHEILLLVAAT